MTVSSANLILQMVASGEVLHTALLAVSRALLSIAAPAGGKVLQHGAAESASLCSCVASCVVEEHVLLRCSVMCVQFSAKNAVHVCRWLCLTRGISTSSCGNSYKAL